MLWALQHHLTVTAVFIMAAVRSLQSLPELLYVFKTAPQHCCLFLGNNCWVNAKLQGLSMYSNAHGAYTWVAISIGSMKIGDTCFALAGNLEAHISLGTWTPAAAWAKQYDSTDKKLKSYSDGLDLQLMLNSEVSSEGLLIFSFCASSISGGRLHSMEQVLSAGGRVLYNTHRGMSPGGKNPGPLFHLSVRRS